MNYIYTRADGTKCRAIHHKTLDYIEIDNGQAMWGETPEGDAFQRGPKLKTSHDWTHDELLLLGVYLRDKWDRDELQSLRWLEKPNSYIEQAWLAGCDVEAE